MSLIDRLLPLPDSEPFGRHDRTDFFHRLRLLRGRRVTIRTVCGKVRGRLVLVRRDFVIVRVTRRRSVLVRVAAICTVKARRRRRRRHHCCCK